MSAQPTEPAAAMPRRQLQAIDPDSPAGKAAALALGELFDDIAARLRREGQPVPDCISP